MSNQTWYVDVRRPEIESGTQLDFHTTGTHGNRKPTLLPGDRAVLVFTQERNVTATIYVSADNLVLEIEDEHPPARWQIRPVVAGDAMDGPHQHPTDTWIVVGPAG